MPKRSRFIRRDTRPFAQLAQAIQRQSPSSLAISPRAFRDFSRRPGLLQRKKRLDLADHLATGTIGIEHLMKKRKEREADVVNAIPAVGTLVRLGEKSRRQKRAKELIQTQEALLADLPDARAEGSQLRTQLREKRCMRHWHSIYTVQCLTGKLKWRS